MKKRIIGLMVVLTFVALMVLGCGKSSLVSGAGKTNYIEGKITPEIVSVALNGTQQFSVTGLVKAADIEETGTAEVIWQVTGGIGTIDATGLFYAAAPGVGAVEGRIDSFIMSAEVVVIDVNQNLLQAQNKLEEGNIDGAHQNYLTVLSVCPSNEEANFGEALIDVLSVATDKNTSTLAKKFNYTTPSTLNGLFNSISGSKGSNVVKPSAFAQMAVTPEVVPSEIQTYIKDTLLPAINKALTRLATIEANPNFKFIISKKLSQSDRDRELDLGEIYSLDILSSMIKATLHEAIAYNWDYSTSNPLAETNFGTLKSDGAANMLSARNAYVRMFTKWAEGINFIAAEVDDQSDDCIPKFNSSAEKDSFLKYINLVKSSLENGATTIDIKSGVNLAIDFKTFYSSPVDDWKVYINAAKNNFQDFDFTINGLFPEMTTSDKWNNFIASLN